ncbi:MAG: hypothetical protein SYR96_22770 [Actinomycetota bacterium]|nr:hypothetical protein [Actinomycetota bacterium]
MTGTKRRHPVPDRARRRAIRALAAQLGVAYSIAARLLANEHRQLLFAEREQRSFHSRVRDTRDAVDLPLGRATHLTARFPRLLTPAGVLYSGSGRQTVLAMLYATVLHESPSSRPAAEELSWVAELGEEAAADITCAALDRAARLLLDDDSWHLWTRIDAALTAGSHNQARHVRDVAITLGRELRTVSLRGSLPGARQTLDALLVEPYEGHAPGTRLRGATVIGVRWQQSGPPTSYETRTTAPRAEPLGV